MTINVYIKLNNSTNSQPQSQNQSQDLEPLEQQMEQQFEMGKDRTPGGRTADGDAGPVYSGPPCCSRTFAPFGLPLQSVG